MKREEKNYQTKKALSISLKKFMEKKPLRKITVTEIITDCDVNRKTFYYHFEDIYALLKWTLEQEAVEVVKQFDLSSNTEEALAFIIAYVEQNSHVLNCAYDSIGREEMKRFLCSDFREIILNLINTFEQNLSLHVGEDFKTFLCTLYTEALAGILIDYFQKPEDFNKDKIVSYITLILHTSIPETLRNASAQ